MYHLIPEYAKQSVHCCLFGEIPLVHLLIPHSLDGYLSESECELDFWNYFQPLLVINSPVQIPNQFALLHIVFQTSHKMHAALKPLRQVNRRTQVRSSQAGYPEIENINKRISYTYLPPRTNPRFRPFTQQEFSTGNLPSEIHQKSISHTAVDSRNYPSGIVYVSPILHWCDSQASNSPNWCTELHNRLPTSKSDTFLSSNDSPEWSPVIATVWDLQ
nr:hypothetical protein Iba_chr03bCG0030 [Ipomoea batatas]GME03767.1 hypothetical protein Iba_scaffold1227CG0010 [Ipomoea batatas]GME06914.1 hypothetical protein Iba_scaffold5724CG0030 [Ipomoea batatas]